MRVLVSSLPVATLRALRLSPHSCRPQRKSLSVRLMSKVSWRRLGGAERGTMGEERRRRRRRRRMMSAAVVAERRPCSPRMALPSAPPHNISHLS